MDLPRVTSSSISRAIFISLLLIQQLTAPAQQPRKVIAIAPDTIPLLRGIQISADMVGLIQMAVSDYGQYEAALKVNLKDKYFPVVELGLGKCDATDPSTTLGYKTSAPYGRIGVDYNLMKNKHDIYRLYGGFRYAFSKFSYDVLSQGITDPVWREKVPFGATDVDGSYHWLEGVLSIDAKIWGPVRMGWSVRYKRRLFHKHGDIGEAWYVPGFGRGGNTRLGGTFNVSIEI
ncbi:hypothetical protein JHU38_06995 [Prevotella sp. A2931]|uniref:DUF3575 domain-containing protein n=1 Tax=Prevotella illustrans TaxID=2800387 RepID=A0ABS3M5R5_9BACT|nr:MULTISPECIES: DUF6048 family protein [Prevotella]MBO1363517.1 hypothetical protein [Prevotella illustrans]